MVDHTTRIAVIGGGMGGLTAALAAGRVARVGAPVFSLLANAV
jgi:salicylate hydroxylase